MSLYLLLVYIHILAAVCWVGYTLFWFMMIPPLRKDFDEKTSDELLRATTDITWPPISLPLLFRIKFSLSPDLKGCSNCSLLNKPM